MGAGEGTTITGTGVPDPTFSGTSTSPSPLGARTSPGTPPSTSGSRSGIGDRSGLTTATPRFVSLCAGDGGDVDSGELPA